MRRLPSLFQKFSIRTRLVVYYLAFAFLALGAVVYVSYTRAVTSLQATMDEKLGVIARLQINDLDRWVDEQQRNAVFLASLPEFRSSCETLLKETSTAEERDFARQRLTNLLGIIVHGAVDFLDIQVVDLAGDPSVGSAFPGGAERASGIRCAALRGCPFRPRYRGPAPP
jgi:hypothetical protein